MSEPSDPPFVARPTSVGCCPACNTPAPPSALFCGCCGANLPRSCPRCSAPVTSDQRFCTTCGVSLSLKGANAVPDGKKEVAAERRLITVVMCDLVRSSDLAARLDPEEFAALLVSYRERCAAMVAHNGGYISRYVGDGILACFGYPRAGGRDAQAAVTCGLAIAREIRSLAANTSLLGGQELAVRVGIETGLVVAGRLGPENAVEFDALVGTAPNVAARIQELAPSNGVVIGEATLELVADDFVSEELPPHRLKSLKQPVRAFIVKGEAVKQGRRPELTRRRGSLVGRTAELALMRECWAESSDGKGQTLLLSGEAGIGKSRLAQELLDYVTSEPHALIVLTCTLQASRTAFRPAIEALREALATTVAESAGTITTEQALADLVAEIGLGVGPALAELGRALGLGPGQTDLAPSARRQLLLKALQAWLLHRAIDQPLLILAEDLHWSDPSLLELLREVADVIPNQQAMLLATYRTDMVLSWPDRPSTRRLALPSLERAEAEQLLKILGGNQSVETREAILARADGIPLFLEEFTFAVGTPTVPRSLQQLFTARLDALGDAKRLAQCAAILAPVIEPDVLGALADLPDDDVENALGRLVDREILARTGGIAGAPPFTFRHALLQQAASESLLGASRRELHARAAVLLSRLRPALIETQPEILAEHHFAAGNFAKAAPLFAFAARRALASAALEEAETEVRRGFDAVSAMSFGEIGQINLDLSVLLGQVLIAKCGYANAAVHEAFELALGAAEQVREEARTLPALRGLASFYQVRGPLSRAAVICDRIVAAVETTEVPCLLVDAWRRRGWNRGCMGQLVEAEEDLTRALDTFDAARLEEHIATSGHDPQVLALANLCWLAPTRHGLTVSVERAEAAAAAAHVSPHSVSACYGLIFAAFILQRAGQFDKALRLAMRALAIANEKCFAYWVALGNVAVGYDQVVRGGNLTDGREAIQIGMARYSETQGELLRPFILSLLAEAHIALGEKEMAEAAIHEATELAAALEADGFLPELLLRYAQLVVGPEGPARRRDLLRRALVLAQTQNADAAVAWIVKESGTG